jgi:GntR family transcriptional regulator
MQIPVPLWVDAQSPIPIRRQLTEQLKHVIEQGGVPRDQALPSIRELAGFLGINPNTVARVIEDLKRSGYVEARRGRGVFVAPAPPARPAPTRRQGFLRDVVVRGAALGMTAEELAVGVLSVAGIRPAAVRETVGVLLVECGPAELDFFADGLEAQLPVRLDKVLLSELAPLLRRGKPGWETAVTSFRHLPELERLLGRTGMRVIALVAEAHLETLHDLAQLPPGTRVGVVSGSAEIAQSLEHSMATAGLPNIVLNGACAVQGDALSRLVRRVDVIVCASAAADRVRRAAGPAARVMIDDGILDQRAIENLAAILVEHTGNQAPAAPRLVRGRLEPPSPEGSAPARRQRVRRRRGK